ncbi:MAG TPA: response regulator [Egibacteraceae bacterium]|nr:response regulator [Egibacteraceae bacterium]
MTRVTVIDPDRDQLDLYRDVLISLGYDVETYTDALPGIDELTASRPDLVIVDVELDPEREQLTGLQVVHSARSGTPLRDVPIIICSTATERIVAALPEVMDRGDVHRLEKPFDLATFERVVQAALGLSHGAAEAARVGNILAHEDRSARG